MAAELVHKDWERVSDDKAVNWETKNDTKRGRGLALKVKGGMNEESTGG